MLAIDSPDAGVALSEFRVAQADDLGPVGFVIERTHQRLRTLVEQLASLDATIQTIDPSVVLERIKPRTFRAPPDWAHRGEMSRIVLSILRTASEPMTTRELAVQMLVERALDRADQRLLSLMVKRVGVSLRHARDAGLTKASQGPGMFMLWEVVR